MPAAESVLIVTVYQFVLVMSLVPLASLAGHLGLRRVFRAGMVVYACATSLCLVATSMEILHLLRVFQALGSALALSVTAALIRNVYPARLLGRGLALNSLTVSLSMAMAPVVGGLLITFAGWASVFAVAAPFAFIGLLLSGSLPDQTRETEDFDWQSAAVYAGLIALLFASLEGSLWAASHWWMRLISLALASVLGTWLVRRANRATQPLLPIDLLRRPLIAFSMCGALCAFASSMAVMVVLPFRLDSLYGFDPIEIGLAMSAWPIATMFAAPAAGVMSDRLPAWAIGTAGLLGAVLSMALLAAAPADARLVDIAWRLGLLGVCYPAYTASNMRLVVANSPHARAASAGSIMSTTRILGQSLGAVIAAWIIAGNWVGEVQGLLVPAVLASCGLVFSFVRRNAS